MKSLTIFSIVVIFAAISSVESAWLFNRRCNGTAIEGWGAYISGECGSYWNSAGYSTCLGSQWTTYRCKSSACQNCQVESVQQMDQCNKKNEYSTCTPGSPDYSSFGSDFATLQFYPPGQKCTGSIFAILAAPINQCINSIDIKGQASKFSSVNVTCSSKTVSATLTMYQNSGCQGPAQNITVTPYTCATDPHFGAVPFIATCSGF